MVVKYFRLAQSVDKDLAKLPKNIQLKILSSFTRLKRHPLAGIKLPGELRNYYKLRVGDYRIIYSFNPKQNLIQVVKIEHRQGVYK